MIELLVCYALNTYFCWSIQVHTKASGLYACLYGGPYEHRRNGADLILKGVRCDDGLTGFAMVNFW